MATVELVKARGTFKCFLGYVEDEGLGVRLPLQGLPGHGKELPAKPQDAPVGQGGIGNAACRRIDDQNLASVSCRSNNEVVFWTAEHSARFGAAFFFGLGLD